MIFTLWSYLAVSVLAALTLVPLSIEASAPLPSAQTKLAASRFFPKVPAAAALTVYDLRQDSAQGKMMAIALQGMINQTGASIYVLVRGSDEPQLALLEKSYQLAPLFAGNVDPGFMALARDKISQIHKVFLWSESEDYTWNIALMMAALENGVPLTEKAYHRLVNHLGYQGPVVDLRGRFTSRISAYDWALTQLMPNMSRTMLFSLGMREDWRSAPWLAYDYAVATRSFTFWLDDRIPAERSMIEKICAAGGYATGTTLLGYGASGDELLSVVNPYGIGFIVADYYANGSVWASYDKKSYRQPEAQAVRAEPEKIYVSLTLSDGDNAQFAQGALFELWQGDPARGSLPVGTTFCPTLQELASPIMDYYYRYASAKDELVAGPSGWQFIYLRQYPAERLTRWLELNRTWLTGAGMTTAHVWHGDYYSDAYRAYLEKSGLTGVFDGEKERGDWLYKETLVHNQGDHLWQSGDLYNALAKIKPNAKAPIFKSLYAITGPYGFDKDHHPVAFTRFKEETERLEVEFPGRFVYLLPRDLIASIKQYRREHENIADLALKTDGDSQEVAYLDFDNSSAVDNDHRFADLDAFWIYRFNLHRGTRHSRARLDLGGTYVVSGSADGLNFRELRRVEAPAPRGEVVVDLSSLLTDNPSSTIYLKFSNGRPTEGYGPSLWHLYLEEQI